MKITAKFIAMLLVLTYFQCVVASAVSDEEIQKAQDSAISAVFGSADDIVFTSDFLDSAGTSTCDWYVIALSRLGIDADYENYLAALENYIIEKYETEQLLDPVKATEWHRLTLACLACGGDPTDIEGINIVSDGITLRNFDKQGLPAYIWGLIASNSAEYYNTEFTDTTIDYILSQQLEDGGFTLFGNVGDVDITSMVVTALAPYRDREEVAKSLENAISFLSSSQLPSGGFASSGVENCESTAQVVIALCSLDLNPTADERFVKNDTSPVDAMLIYETDNSMFSHILSDKTPNQMATQQALLAFAAYKCYLANVNLYSFETDSIETESDDNFPQIYRGMIDGYSKSVCASDIDDIKKLSSLLDSTKPDDYQVLKNKLESALFEAENTLSKIEELDSDILALHKSYKLFGIEKSYNMLLDRFESLDERDKELVTNAGLLEKIEDKVKLSGKRIGIAVSLIVVVAVCAVILVKTKKKYDL